MSDDSKLYRVRMMRNTVVKNPETGLGEARTPLRKNKDGVFELTEVFAMCSEIDCVYLCSLKKAIPACEHSEKLMSLRGRLQ